MTACCPGEWHVNGTTAPAHVEHPRHASSSSGYGPGAPPLPPIGLTAAALFARAQVSRADWRVRSPGTLACARCPACTSALDAGAEAYDNPAAVWWGAFALSVVIRDLAPRHRVRRPRATPRPRCSCRTRSCHAAQSADNHARDRRHVRTCRGNATRPVDRLDLTLCLQEYGPQRFKLPRPRSGHAEHSP